MNFYLSDALSQRSSSIVVVATTTTTHNRLLCTRFTSYTWYSVIAVHLGLHY